MFDRVVWVTRYSKGGVRYREAMAMDGWELRRFEEALARLIARENQRPDPTDDDGGNEPIEIDEEDA